MLAGGGGDNIFLFFWLGGITFCWLGGWGGDNILLAGGDNNLLAGGGGITFCWLEGGVHNFSWLFNVNYLSV